MLFTQKFLVPWFCQRILVGLFFMTRPKIVLMASFWITLYFVQNVGSKLPEESANMFGGTSERQELSFQYRPPTSFFYQRHGAHPFQIRLPAPKNHGTKARKANPPPFFAGTQLALLSELKRLSAHHIISTLVLSRVQQSTYFPVVYVDQGPAIVPNLDGWLRGRLSEHASRPRCSYAETRGSRNENQCRLKATEVFSSYLIFAYFRIALEITVPTRTRYVIDINTVVRLWKHTPMGHA